VLKGDRVAGDGVQSVRTALRVLEAVAAHESVGVSQLASALGVPKTTIQRMLYTLKDAGWIIEAGGDMTRWSLTSRMFRLAHQAADNQDIRRRVLPMMHQARARTLETVHLAVQEGDSVVVIERLESPKPVRTNVALGTAAPLVASANGKAILSTWPEHEVRALVAHGIEPYTPRSVTDPETLLSQVREARQRGFAVNHAEWREDVAAVAVPIVEHGERARAGISVSTPAHRMSPERQLEYGRLLVGLLREFP
jgi:IclR family acetate operon transcriptional repressor